MMKILKLSVIKSAAVLLVALFLTAVDSAAQTPQFYNYDNGTSYNSFPLNVAAGKMVQSLIAAGEFNQPAPAIAGNITKLYLRISTGYPLGPATYTNFRILFSQAAITVLPTGSFYSGVWDTVYKRTSVTLTAAASTWMEITLDHPYTYNPAQGLILQIEQCGATGTITGYAIQQSSTPGVGRRSYSAGACPYTYAGLTTSVINCGIDLTPVSGFVLTSNELPKGCILSQNYPNPFNPVTKINFAITKPGGVKIVVYDELGRQVQTLVNEMLQPGTYTTSFDASMLPSGVYFYRMEVRNGGSSTENFSDVKRFVVLK